MRDKVIHSFNHLLIGLLVFLLLDIVIGFSWDHWREL